MTEISPAQIGTHSDCFLSKNRVHQARFTGVRLANEADQNFLARCKTIR